MATVQLKNVKKIYPFISGEGKKKKKKDEGGEEKKVNSSDHRTGRRCGSGVQS